MTDLAEIGRGVVESRPVDVAAETGWPRARRPLDLGTEVGRDPVGRDPVGRPVEVAAAAGGFAVDTAAEGTEAMSRPLDRLQAELVTAAGAVLLLASLLLLPWFGVNEAIGRSVPRAAMVGSLGAWHTLTWLRWPVLLAVALALVPLLARPADRWFGLPRRTHTAVAVIGGLTALLLGYRVLIDLPDPSRVVDQQAGAILGLVGALAITLGALEAMRAPAAPPRARKAPTRTRRVSVPPGRAISDPRLT